MNKSIALFFMFLGSSALAGGNHFHPKKVANCKVTDCTELEIKASVQAGITALQKWGKIDKKWIGAEASSVVLRTFKKGEKTITVWVANISRQTKNGWDYQYVYFTKKGKVFRANDSGELK